MILEIKDLKKRDFQLSKINIIHQKPVYRDLKCTYRMVNGFLYIVHGMGRYTFAEGAFDLQPGALVYLPLGSVHTLEIFDDGIEFYRIDFNITADNEEVLFCDHPIKMCDSTPAECIDAIKSLSDECEFNQDNVRKKELMCTIFRTIDANSKSDKNRLLPAINYLLEHLTEKIACSELCKSCNLGSSQFYTLFKEEYGMSPLEYRDKLVIKRASMLLRDGSFSITEISEMLGFESVSYFSRFFKKSRGVSPSQFIKNY